LAGKLDSGAKAHSVLFGSGYGDVVDLVVGQLPKPIPVRSKRDVFEQLEEVALLLTSKACAACMLTGGPSLVPDTPNGKCSLLLATALTMKSLPA